MKKIHLLALAVVFPVAWSFAQKPADTASSQDDLHRQIEAVGGAKPAFKGLPGAAAATESRPVGEPGAAPVLKKVKGPTEIDALEATFDQKKNEAIFIGEVVVKDPEFNVKCDKLTAILKSADAPKAAVEGPGPKPAKPATPAPPAKKKGSSGLQKAIAEASPGSRVDITQDKVDADGTIQHSVGQADKATYDVVTGDIVLTGSPQIQQGINLIVATSPATVMTLNRDGHMNAKGPTKTVIVDKGDAGL